MNQRLTHKMITELDMALYQRLRTVVAYSNTFPTVAAFVRDALDRAVREAEAMGPTFEQAWAASHSGLQATSEQQWAAYRCGPRDRLHPHRGRIYFAELLEHLHAGRWDERTGVLVRHQLAECAKNGHTCAPAGLDPPGFALAAPAPKTVKQSAPDEDGEIY